MHFPILLTLAILLGVFVLLCVVAVVVGTLVTVICAKVGVFRLLDTQGAVGF